jgi:DNA-binding transcriptional MerR regulator/ubiquinone/menaquinone biosynthesis C-methylase UbiE
MKIGKFAEANNVSLDTIRHYMELGLIVPLKSGGQYDFDERCEKDLKDVLNLKQMGFSLNDIKAMLMFVRLGKLTPYQEEQYYREFFTNKLNAVALHINELTLLKEKLEQRIRELTLQSHNENYTMGIDINALKLLKCCSCGKDLVLDNGHVLNNQIISGSLRCSCGEEYTIEDGILLGKGIVQNSYVNFNHNYIADYVSLTDYEYLDNIYEGLEWAYKRLDFNRLSGNTLLELGSGGGFFLRHIYNSLPDDSIYIAVDHDLNRHKFLKNMLERAECKRNVLFICSDFLTIPIKNEVADLIIDFTGTSNYSFEHEDFLLYSMLRFAKEESYLLSAFIMFKNFGITTGIKEPLRKNFILSHVKEEVSMLGYKLIDERISDYVEHGGVFEDYFKKDEKVYTYNFYGKR